MEKLTHRHHKLFAIEHDDHASRNNGTVKSLYKDNRAVLLKNIPPSIIKKAWFTFAHLLVGTGAHIVDMGCEDGKMAYTMAVLNPDIKITGVDRDKRAITLAKKKYKRDNLAFKVSDITNADFDENSLDAIINSYTCHEIYSNSDYSDRSVTKALENQFRLLKQDGLMFMRDHALPPSDDFVIMEFPDKPGKGKEPEDMSEAELLIHYSEIARSSMKTGYSGFFLEELPPRFPGTRLFRLPYKWAYEFMMRKDDRKKWKEELSKEYAFFSQKDFRRQLKSIGARLLYSAPHWNDSFIDGHFKNHFKLYAEDGQPIGYPPTSFVAVVQNAGQRKSLAIEERRYAKKRDYTLQITAMRDETNGKITDIVSRNIEIIKLLPYCLTEKGKLRIYLHEGLPRGIVNAVPRNGSNLDGKEWSGHMIETIGVNSDIIRTAEKGSLKDILRFTHNHTGLKPAIGCKPEIGPTFYPDPHHIDERLETRYLCVEPSSRPFWEPKNLSEDIDGFSGKGKIREFDAQAILNAISVGLIPNSRLELLILALFEKLSLKPEKWSETPLRLKETENLNIVQVRDLVSQMAEEDTRFKCVKGSTGDLKILNSVFVDECQNQKGGMTGLATKNIEFFVSEDNTINTAVVLPLTKDINGEVMAGIVTEFLPIPQRFKGNGFTVSAPSFTLPKDIKTIEDAKRYIAAKFEIDPKDVTRMGESFFCHNGLTPQRIYPFAVTNVKDHYNGRGHGSTTYTSLRDLWRLLYLDNYDSFMKVVGLAYIATIGQDSEMSPDFCFSTSQAEERSKPTMESAAPLSPIPTANDSSYDRKYRVPE